MLPLPASNTVSDAPTTAGIKPRIGTTSRPVSVLDADPEAKKLSDNFEKNRGSLPWPVAGNVSMHFGLQKYIEGITFDNPGITIETAVEAPVKAVFNGEVTAVISIGADTGGDIKTR